MRDTFEDTIIAIKMPNSCFPRSAKFAFVPDFTLAYRLEWYYIEISLKLNGLSVTVCRHFPFCTTKILRYSRKETQL